MKEYNLKIEAIKRETEQFVKLEQLTVGYSENDVRNIANESLRSEFKILKIEVTKKNKTRNKQHLIKPKQIDSKFNRCRMNLIIEDLTNEILKIEVNERK